MGEVMTGQVLEVVPLLLRLGSNRIWMDYDEEADVLYMSFGEPQEADDSELTEDEVIVRYKEDEVIGVTVLNAKERFQDAEGRGL